MAEAVNICEARPSAWSSFFGNVQGAIETGISKIGSEVLPNWAEKQLGLQSQDQLEKTTFDESKAPSRVDAIQSAVGGVVSPMQQTAFSIGGVKISYAMLALGFGAVLVVAYAIRS